MGAPGILRSALACLEAGDWQGAHAIVQRDEESSPSCWAHGIVHVMEGDLANARYWYREAGRPFPEPCSVPAEIAALKAALSSTEKTKGPA